MYGDFSRRTFDGSDAYRSVLLQQGRVMLDADWNEQAEITAHHDEVRSFDIVGRSGGPAPDPDPVSGPASAAGPFAILAADGTVPDGTAWKNLRVTPGTYYVDGILCESPAPVTAGTGPPPPGWPLTDRPLLPTDLDRLDQVPLLAEPDAAATGDRYALYLDVWNHHVTGDEDVTLIEPALGGPDTTTRARTVWRVRPAKLDPGQQCQDLHLPGWRARTPGTLTAALAVPPPGSDPCQISTAGGYQGLENQLYRVQVHDEPASDGTGGTFVWSRDNGSVVARVVKLEVTDAAAKQATLTLDRVGRDDELSFREGQLVEVTSSDRELRGRPGFLAITGAPTDVQLPITWSDPVPGSLDDLGAVPIVRRWDGGPAPIRTAGTDLEAGIGVAFSAGGDLRTGDYWQIPARTVRLGYGLTQVSGTIEWPPGGRGPLRQPPAGPEHHVTPLAIVRLDAGGWTRESDCRLLFPSLTDLVSLDLVGGDGQEARPGQPLPEPVRVVVRNGGLPVSGARLSVEASDGGQVSIPGPPETAADGVLAVGWLLQPNGPSTQTLTLRRLDSHGQPIDAPVVVTGRLSIASEVAWQSTGGCDGIRADTVQEALDQLARHKELRLLGGDGQSVGQPLDVVPRPVRVIVDSPCGPVRKQILVVRAEADMSRVAPAVEGDPTPATLDGVGSEVIEIPTGKDGTASIWWQPGFVNDRTTTLRIGFKGREEGGLRVVCQLTPPGNRTPGVHIVRASWGGGVRFANDSDVRADLLANGVVLTLDTEIEMKTVVNKPVARVMLDLPWPLGGTDADVWADGPIGFRTITLDGVCTADNFIIGWHATARTEAWLLGPLWQVLRRLQWDRPILARYELEGWAIHSLKDPRIHLNGHAQAILDPDPTAAYRRTELQLPTDDEIAGGRFVQWFRLLPPDGLVFDAADVEVPDVSGRTEAVAGRLIETAGLTVASVEIENGDPVRKGLVTRTDPPAGTTVAAGAGIRIFVSAGRG